MTMSALQRCQHFGLMNIRGLAYMPGPSNYREGTAEGSLYENSDFYTNIFEDLWGSSDAEARGRRDLERYRQQLGINFIHCYDWAAPVSQIDEGGRLQAFLTHTGFLAACTRLGMQTAVPISNYTMGLLSRGEADLARRNVEKIVAEVYSDVPGGGTAPLPGVAMWKIFNEYELCHDRDPQHVVTAIAWIADWEVQHGVQDEAALPVLVCTSFGIEDGIEGAGYLRKVHDAMLLRGRIGNETAADFWSNRIVFATNPQREAAAITDYLETRLPAYWRSNGVAAPPVMFTELGSSIEQTGGERQQAEWLAGQISASKPGNGGGNMMLGACIFLNEERPWAKGPERTFGITRFLADSSWPYPPSNFVTPTRIPVWDPKGWYWQKDATYPVEQQAPKLNYQIVAEAWRQG